MTTTTTTPTSRASLRDVNEAAFRCLIAHGASHGEAKAAAQMVLQAELVGGGGLRALLDDLNASPWSRGQIEISATPGDAEGDRGHLVLRSPEGNRMLRVAPLAVELVASGDARLVGVPTSVTDPDPLDAALLDAVTLELARVCGVGIAVVTCPSTGSPPDAADGGAGEGSSPQSGRVRWARPDGSMGVGILDSLPSPWQRVLTGPGVLALRDVGPLRDVALRWISAEDRVRRRAAAGAAGLLVDADLWRSVQEASRRYLVPDR